MINAKEVHRRMDQAEKKISETATGKYRHKYHLMPPTGWLNDPNGLSYYGGNYHVFFQYAPENARGGDKCWGHYQSPDLLNWEYTGIAIYPDTEYDRNGAYSGGALTDDGNLELFYTGNLKEEGDFDYINEGRGATVIYLSTEDGVHLTEKELLMTNDDYPADLSRHVRDPKVWKKNGRWYMVQGARTKEDQGEVLLFTSGDGVKWFCTHRLKSPKPFGFMWECPDLYELDGYTVLSISPQGLEADGWKYRNQYQTVAGIIHGDFRTDGVPGAFREIDGGFDFYAPQTFVDSTGRRILIGWMGMADADEQYTNRSVEDGWQHVLTLPRELSVRDGVLCQNPVREIGTIWKQKERFEGSYEKHFETDCYELTLLPKEGAWKVILSKGLELSYDPEAKLFCMEFTDKELGCGRTIRGRELDEVTDARIIVDASCVEVFLNGGKDVFSTRFYPETGNYQVEVHGEHVTGDFLSC